MFFVGIDLAWSQRNSSGIAIIKGQKDRASFVCGTSDIHKDNEIIDYILTHTQGNPALIAIDASFEVFPHSALVVIFKLKKTLKYKSGKNRDYNVRWQEFEKYQSYLKSLESRKPSLHLPNDILNTDVRTLKGKALKQYEDLLDAIFCAYIAFYYWADPGKCSVIGDLNDGYMVTPVFRHLKMRGQRK